MIYTELNGKLVIKRFNESSFVNGWSDFETIITGYKSGNVVTLRVTIALVSGHADMPANTEWSIVVVPDELLPAEALTFSSVSENGIPVKLIVTRAEGGKLKIRTTDKAIGRVGIHEVLTYVI